jgi:hypothetical protein
MIGRLRELLAPGTATARTFFIGLAVGLVALSLVGKAVSAQPLVLDHVRLHRYVMPESLFYKVMDAVHGRRRPDDAASLRDAGEPVLPVRVSAPSRDDRPTRWHGIVPHALYLIVAAAHPGGQHR